MLQTTAIGDAIVSLVPSPPDPPEPPEWLHPDLARRLQQLSTLDAEQTCRELIIVADKTVTAVQQLRESFNSVAGTELPVDVFQAVEQFAGLTRIEELLDLAIGTLAVGVLDGALPHEARIEALRQRHQAGDL